MSMVSHVIPQPFPNHLPMSPSDSSCRCNSAAAAAPAAAAAEGPDAMAEGPAVRGSTGSEQRRSTGAIGDLYMHIYTRATNGGY